MTDFHHKNTSCPGRQKQASVPKDIGTEGNIEEKSDLFGSAADQCRLYDETDWADYIMEQVDPQRAERMLIHSRQCRLCQLQMWEWNRLLLPLPKNEVNETSIHQDGVESTVRGSSTHTVQPVGTRPNAYQHTENGSSLYPDEAVKARLLRQFINEAASGAAGRRRIRQESPRARAGKMAVWSAAVLTACATVLLVIGLFRFDSHNPSLEVEPLISYLESQEPGAVQVVRAPDSRLSSLIPATEQGWGMIWLTVNADEAVLLLEGLSYKEQADYQVWAVSGNQNESLGLFKQSGTRAHLHIQNAALKSAVNISYSEEPKGGSTKPTSSKTVLYVLP